MQTEVKTDRLLGTRIKHRMTRNWLKTGNGLTRWVAVVTHLREVLDRFLEVVQCADSARLADGACES